MSGKEDESLPEEKLKIVKEHHSVSYTLGPGAHIKNDEERYKSSDAAPVAIEKSEDDNSSGRAADGDS